jgi:adenylosuccinate synthase
MMMKGDVLSDFEKIKICTSYKFKNEEIDYLPFSLDDGDLTPIYKDLSGWKTDVSEILDGAKLPEEFKSYVKFIENYVKVPITLVSVGPDREQTIDLV